MSVVRDRRLTITDALVRAYSRRGNYHSDAATAARLGLGGLVAQGLQVAGPAYGELLDAWGEDFLAHGEIDMKFVGVVMAGDTVAARVVVDDGRATFEVVNASADRVAVVGSASVSSGA
jgi:acyl dehydratase